MYNGKSPGAGAGPGAVEDFAASNGESGHELSRPYA